MTAEWRQPVRLGAVATVKARLGWKGLKAEEYQASGHYFLSTPTLKGHRIDFDGAEFISQWRYEESPEIQLRVGDVLLVKDGSTLGIANLVRSLPGPATLNGSIALVRCGEGLEPLYLLQCVRGAAFQNLIRLKKAGLGVPHLFQADLREFQLDLPPIPEQRLIAAILDTIDDDILETEQIIAKLKQVKQGLLHDLLTRGIDDNGELRDPERHPEQFKDSPLGRIPRGWAVAPLGQTLVRIEAGKSPSCPDRPARGDDWGVLKVSAVRPTGFQHNENKVVINMAQIDPTLEVQHGDLLITRANTYELVGLTCLVEQPPPHLMLCDKTLRLVLDPERAEARFIFFTTQMPYVRAQIETHATGSSGSIIGQRAIRSIRMRLPPPLEQTAIAAQLNAVDTRRTSEERSLASARMMKSGLMEDVLTGRVRVTGLLNAAAS